ncbi:MAG TPA: class I SAM-dependent methyltransferase [Burkholderiales bacterium]|nr:class I SAM-dependent methyltransferase [Burkholderiales bacterium]
MAPLDRLDLSYRVARCARCKFAFADKLAPPEVYATYYRTLSKYDLLTSPDAVPPAHRIRARAAVALCEKHLDKEAPVADLGCGAGVLLDAFRRAGWMQLSGIDPAPNAAEQARTMFGLQNVHSGMLQQAGERIDLPRIGLVCLTGVLEHLPDLRQDLENLTGQLSHEAMILVEVPALERFLAPQIEPFGEFSLEHLQYFSAASLTHLFESVGYRAVALRLLALPAGTTDSLMALFARRRTGTQVPADAPDIDEYVRRSASAFDAALARIDACQAKHIAIYGAGSHTARLLPRMLQPERGARVTKLVDSNPNLWGKSMGGFRIEVPESLDGDRKAAILISSFRSQEAIAQALAKRFPNPLLRLY